MRQAYYAVALSLKTGREHALSGDADAAVNAIQGAIRSLRSLPPERTRDVLLAHAYLARYQTLALADREVAIESLHLGVSYARSTRDPLARAIAEECLAGPEPAV